MPDGKPAPYVMEPEEAATFMRLSSANPDETLRYYRQQGRLVGTQVGKKVVFQLPDLIEFLRRQRDEVPR